MSEIKTWANTVGQQIENMAVDLVATTAANVSEASGDVFFVGRPAQNGQDWILKKITPTELEKMVYNYLTSNAVAPLLAQVLGEYSEKTISVAGKNSVSFNSNSCAMLIWCVRGVSFMVGVATIENTNIRTIREGYGTLTYSSPNATLTFESTPGVGCVLHYTLIGFKN